MVPGARGETPRAVVDTKGLPVQIGLTPGETHDNQLCSVLLSELRPQTMVLADRGYDADWIRALVNEQGAWANIRRAQSKKPDPFQPASRMGTAARR